jgi:dTDP-glucose 4,6-dehydratase
MNTEGTDRSATGAVPFSRAVVAGGLGFLGSHLCARLVDSGVEVVCLDNLITGRTENVARLMPSRRFHILELDVAERRPIPGPVDLVLHFASPASPLDYAKHPLETMRAGSAGTWNMLELATEKQARFVLASTSEIYGEPLEHPQKESYWGNVNPVGPRSVYDESKRFSEALTSTWGRHRGTRTAIVRLFNCFGPAMRTDDGRAVPTFVRQALDGAAITVSGDGSQTRTLCYVDDAVNAILAVAASDRPGPFNVGGTQEITILELADRIRRLVGSASSVRFVDRPVDDPSRRRPDLHRIHDQLGWYPQIRLQDGLRRTVEWFLHAAEAEPCPPIGPAQAQTRPSTRSPGAATASA